MTTPGFTPEDFQVFQIAGLEPRMQAIRERIQPKFQIIGNELSRDLSAWLGKEMHLHIAKHLRRTKNPPNDTWLAVADNPRGYKKHPHFQVGLFDDHLFVWLAYIYELPNKSEIASVFIEQIDNIKQKLPRDYVISMDHTKKEAASIAEVDWASTLVRFRDVKKAELLIGRHIKAGNPMLLNGQRLLSYIRETLQPLLPIYNFSMREFAATR